MVKTNSESKMNARHKPNVCVYTSSYSKTITKKSMMHWCSHHVWWSSKVVTSSLVYNDKNRKRETRGLPKGSIVRYQI